MAEKEELKIEKEEHGSDILAFLMAGQSNMAGRGDTMEVEPIANDRCFMFRMGKWQPMCEPINVDKGGLAEFAPGISLAASFADELARVTGRKIGLIPCAHGGSSIEEWLPGEVLFDHAVCISKLALRSASLGGILWHQGESNCRHFEKDGYKDKLISVIEGLRSQLDCSDKPFIMGGIPEVMGERWDMGDTPVRFNNYITDISKKIPLCTVASSVGLPLREDGIHFSAAACREFGSRYLKEYLDLINESPKG